MEPIRKDQHADMLFGQAESLAACTNYTCSKRVCSWTGVQTVIAVHFSQHPSNAESRPYVQGFYRQAARHALGAGLTALLSLSALRMPAQAGEILQGPATVSDGDTITVSSRADASSAWGVVSLICSRLMALVAGAGGRQEGASVWL